MFIRNHSAERPACFRFSNSLVIPVGLDGSVLVVDEKGSLGANHAGVCMVVKLGTAFSLASRSSEGTQPGCSYADKARGAVILRRAANQRLGTSPLCPSSENCQLLSRSRALLVQLDFCLFTLFIGTSLSLLSVSKVRLVLYVSPACETKAEIKSTMEPFNNYIFDLFPPPLGVRK